MMARKKSMRLKKIPRKAKGEAFKALLVGQRVTSSEKPAKDLYEKASFGELTEDKIIYSFVEAMYLLEQGRIKLYSAGKSVSFDTLLKKASKSEPNFYTKFIVFRDMRNKGYIVKTALKFGADFRVYSKGKKPGQEHAKWILYPVAEGSAHTWQEFSAKNRVAHSTRKRLLIGIVDDEADVTYYEIAWERP